MANRPHRVEPKFLEFAKEMRQEAAPAEKKVWWCLRNRRLNGFKFRRQYAIGSYIADFFCAECMLIIELDGDSHAGRQDKDEQRSRWFESQGYSVVRYYNRDVHEHLEAVLSAILRACECRAPNDGAGRISRSSPSPPPSPLSTGERG
jgi:very-short-patch-repair endonuclease